MNAVHLRRLDPARNMQRFYRLDVQPDLFGGILLVKEWGRIGAHGRMVAEPYQRRDGPSLGIQCAHPSIVLKGHTAGSEPALRSYRLKL
jgi:WGR domain